jgi:adenosylcobinamide kinase/adenosylcobinamide-phosphate guanylyltransferase
MEVIAGGTGGASGWPEPGCRCASCLRAARVTPRTPSAVVVDGVLRLGLDGPAGEHGNHLVREIPGGWDVTAPDGARLLYLGDPPADAAPYDVAFVDVLGDPFLLGALRARRLVTAGTVVIAACADHRARTPAELERLCALWRVGVLSDGASVTTVSYEKREAYRVLVLGGARSGKSERAEQRVAAEPAVTYVATGPAGDGDPEWAARVAAHRSRRPAWWRTVETTDVSEMLAGAEGTVLIDGIGTWLASVMDECGAWAGGTVELAGRVEELTKAWRQTSANVVAVSDETGLGVVPPTPAGRLFRDWLGRVNRALAAESEEAELVVAGRVIPLDSSLGNSLITDAELGLVSGGLRWPAEGAGRYGRSSRPEVNQVWRAWLSSATS